MNNLCISNIIYCTYIHEMVIDDNVVLPVLLLVTDQLVPGRDRFLDRLIETWIDRYVINIR